MGKHHEGRDAHNAGHPRFGKIGMAVRRWRNVRGFGVHSPAAYAIMRDVVRPSRLYGLYSYHQLDCLRELPEYGDTETAVWRRIRMLLRLCRHLAPSTLKISASAHSPLFHLPRLAGVREVRDGETPTLWVTEILPSPPTSSLITTTSSRPSPPTSSLITMTSSLKSGCTVVLLDGAVSMTGTLSSAMKGGIIVLMKRCSLLIPIKDSALSTYYA